MCAAEEESGQRPSSRAVSRSAATFGPPKGLNKPNPTEFLKSRSSETLRKLVAPSRQKKHFRKAVLDMSQPQLLAQSSTDFIRQNAMKAISLQPPLLPASEQNFLAKPEYGEVPKYLVKAKLDRTNRIIEQRAANAQSLQQELNGKQMQLSAADKLQLLQQLKTKWGQLNAAFQKLPLQADTPSKLKHKELLETELAQTEADIQLLQLQENVIVCFD